tara:strand:+ start:3868 stop:4170 length:303 start_codon:yes stop_codon:yes gene_type:complete
MNLIKQVVEDNNQLCLHMTKELTFKTVSDENAKNLLKLLSEKSPSQLIINCKDIISIDSCGLALLIYIVKSLPNTKTKLVATSTKLEKLRTLYLSTNDHL